MAREILFTFELETGMRICEDVLDSKKRLVVTQGTIVNPEIINKLDSLSIMEVAVDTEIDVIPEMDDLLDMVSAAAEAARENQSFSFFEDEHTTDINVNQGILDSLAQYHTNMDVDNVIATVQRLLCTYKDSMKVFDLLHEMEHTDEITYQHSVKVTLIGQTLGKWLGFSTEDLEQLALAGMLHDLGKMRVPSEILNKKGKLTKEEYEVVKGHVIKGYEVIKDMDLDIRVKEACLMHHERCDGTGYPLKLKQERISSFAKIIAIADVYEAMTSVRSYRKNFCPFDVIQLFESEGLYKYDPQYIMTFLHNIVSSYLNTNIRLTDGRVGEIVMINQNCLYKPVVRVDNEFIDLSRQFVLKIAEVL